jgi:hypothetical protein
MTQVVVDIAELTPAVLTQMLNRAGRTVTVSDVAAEPIGVGQMAASYRLRLTHDAADRLPETLVAKIGAAEEAARLTVCDGYAREVGFYQLLAERVGSRSPVCWYAAGPDERGAFVLLLEDLCHARVGDQLAGCGVAEATSAALNLAGLAASNWCDESLFGLGIPGMVRVDAPTAEFLAALMDTAMDRFVDHYDAQLSDHAKGVLDSLHGRYADWLQWENEPFALAHGDYRLDNLLFSDDTVWALDWQTLGVAPPLRDLAYLLGTSMLPEDRARHESQIITAYVESLTDRGVRDISRAECEDGYRRGMLLGPLVGIVGCMYAPNERTERSDAMFITMAERSTRAIDDLGSLELLG